MLLMSTVLLDRWYVSRLIHRVCPRSLKLCIQKPALPHKQSVASESTSARARAHVCSHPQTRTKTLVNTHTHTHTHTHTRSHSYSRTNIHTGGTNPGAPGEPAHGTGRANQVAQAGQAYHGLRAAARGVLRRVAFPMPLHQVHYDTCVGGQQLQAKKRAATHNTLHVSESLAPQHISIFVDKPPYFPGA